MQKIFAAILILGLIIFSCTNHLTDPEADSLDDDTVTGEVNESAPIEAYYPIPTAQQLAWQDNELAMFIHFGVNTFTGNEWGDGTEDPAIFNPENLDAEQWVDIAKECGFKYIILTAKHHDGFCLWPSEYTDHSVASSPYKNGKGDIVKEFAEACHNNDIDFSFYLSPWDRHEETYGTDAYNEYFQKQLIELLSNYGDVGEVWFDGANGEASDNEKTDYDWDMYFNTVRNYQPDALMAIVGPDIKWVGNEDGLGSETEWCFRDKGYSMQNVNNGKVWWPTECDVSIRPGWFYRSSEDDDVKSVDKLVEIYFASVGRNSNLLLNVPPNEEGLISDVDKNRLLEWRDRLDQIFADDLFEGKTIEASNIRGNSEDYVPANCLDDNRKTFWVTDKDTTTAELVIDLGTSQSINIIRLEEAIAYGQRIKAFKVYAMQGDSYQEVFEGTTIGRSRIIQFNAVSTNKIKIVIEDSYASPTLRIIKGFYSTLI